MKYELFRILIQILNVVVEKMVVKRGGKKEGTKYGGKIHILAWHLCVVTPHMSGSKIQYNAHIIPVINSIRFPDRTSLSDESDTRENRSVHLRGEALVPMAQHPVW